MRLGHGTEHTQMTESQILQNEPVDPLLDQPHVLEPKEGLHRLRELQRMKTGSKAIAESEQLHRIPLLAELARHLKGDIGTAAIAGQQIRSSRLHLPHVANAVCSHGLDA